MMNIEFHGMNGVCCFDPGSCRVGANSRIVIRATQKVRCKGIMLTPERMNRRSIIRPLGRILHITAGRSSRERTRGEIERERTFGVYRGGVHRRNLRVGLVSTRCAFSGGGILFCFATSNEVSFHRLMGSLTTVFGAHVRLHRVNIHSRAGVLKKVNVYKEYLYYRACLSRFTPMSVGVTGRRGLSLGRAGVSNIYKELVYYLGGRRRACRRLGGGLPKLKSAIAAPSKLAKAMRDMGILHRHMGMVMRVGSRGRVRRFPMSSLGFEPEGGGIGISRGRLGRLKGLRSGGKSSGLGS